MTPDERTAAQNLARNLTALHAGEVTPEQARATNRKLRAPFSEDRWERIKWAVVVAAEGKAG